MKIPEIVDKLRDCLSGYRSKFSNALGYVCYGSFIYIRNKKTLEVFALNQYGKYKVYNKDIQFEKDAYTNLIEGDYEIYDPIRVYGVAYLIPDKKDASSTEIIGEMYKKFESDSKENRLCGCSAWINGSPSSFDLYTKDENFQIRVMSVTKYAHLNNTRKSIESRCIPFDKSMPDNSIVLLFILDELRYEELGKPSVDISLNNMPYKDFGLKSCHKINFNKSYGFHAN